MRTTEAHLAVTVELTQADLLTELVAVWRTCRDSAWDFAEVCARIDQQHGRKQLKRWCAEHCEIHDESRISKLVTFGTLLADDERRERWRRLPMWSTDRLCTL